MSEIIPGPGRLFIAPAGTPPESAWKLLGETWTDGIVTTPQPPPPPMTLAEMQRLVDRLTLVVVCHPDDRAMVEAKLAELRAAGQPTRPVEVVANPHLTPGEIWTMPKALAL